MTETYSPDEVAELLPYLTEKELAHLDKLLGSAPKWVPQPGPQTDAYTSHADIVGFGGAAGGGKSSLGVGLSLTQHRKSIIFRQTGTELTGVVDELTRVIGSRDGYNGSERIWRPKLPDGQTRQIELGSFPNAGDEIKYQGRDHDLIVYDETANMREQAVRFLMGWLRSAHKGQRCRVLMTFNPPTTVEGRWILNFFGPWLDPQHSHPAQPGELRWFTTIDGEDFECSNGKPFRHGGEMIRPMSRTFIPSKVQDNFYLKDTNYIATLRALPEPLRSQMLYGDFSAGIEDDPWQVIPTAWVERAQARWVDPGKRVLMDSLGVDVARGGRDNTILAPRHGLWFDRPVVYPGAQTPDGPTVAGHCIAVLRDRAVIHIDVIGVGSSPYDFLMQARQQVVGVNVAERARGMDKSGRLAFLNLRSELWWRMREALDPQNNTGIALPPEPKLTRDLCTPKWSLSGSTIKVQSRENIITDLGRSPDYGSAYILALMDTPKTDTIRAMGQSRRSKREYDAVAGH